MSKVTLFHMYLATGDNQVQTCTHNRKCITGGLKRAEGGSPHDAHSLLLNAARYLFHVLFAHGLQCNITWTKDYLMSNLTALDICILTWVSEKCPKDKFRASDICWIKTVFLDFPLYTNTVMILALNQKDLQNIFISCLGIAAIFIHSSLFQRLKIYWTIDWQAI